jgi:agmatinase
VPLVIGGDDSIAPILARTLADHGTFDVVTMDSHLGRRRALRTLPSPAPRISELPQVKSVTQIGLRGIGGSRTGELEEARAAGHRLITAAEVHQPGQQWLCDQLPVGRPRVRLDRL